MRVLAGRYAVGELVGRGGIGEVHRAHDTVLDRVVAIKSLREDHVDDRDLAQRLDDEARAAASFTHANAVVLYDVVVEDGRTHLVMELVDGAPLPAVLQDGVLPVGLACLVARDVASALAAAHERGLVHRDVKPSNVLVARDGVVKLADFGIARMAGRSGARLTMAGTVVGSAAYLAPEQLQDGDVDGRADVYALGLVLGEVLTGSLGFGDGTWSELLSRRLTVPPRPLTARGDDGLAELLPPGLEALVTRMTTVAPADRPTAAAVERALRPFADDGARRRLAARLPDVTDVDPGAPTQVMATHEPTRVVSRPEVAPTSVLPVDEFLDLEDAAGDADDSGDTPTPGRSLPFVTAVAVASLLALVVIVGLALRSGNGANDGDGGTAPPSPGTPLAVVAATDLDPLGDGREHPEDLAFLVDGDLGTVWETEQYTTPDLGGAKAGVGLVFDLGEPRSVREMVVELRDDGVDLEIWSSTDDPAGRPAPEVGAQRAALVGADAGTLTIEVGGVEARWWMIWITRVGQGRATIAEVTFR